MMKKWGILLLVAGFIVGACKNDDDDNELPQDEQNQVDDDAIVEYLEDHFFDPERGLITEYDDEDEDDDNYPNLRSQGTKLSSGVWIVKREGIEATGDAATSNAQDSILISINTYGFRASNQDLTEDETLYSSIVNIPSWSTINTSGTPTWDPAYYYTNITDEMTENEIGIEHFVIEGFVEGLKHFQATNTSGSDLYDFQGAIIVPSRLAFARDYIYNGTRLDNQTYRDLSFVFNFELHKVIDRNN